MVKATRDIIREQLVVSVSRSKIWSIHLVLIIMQGSTSVFPSLSVTWHEPIGVAIGPIRFGHLGSWGTKIGLLFFRFLSSPNGSE